MEERAVRARRRSQRQAMHNDIQARLAFRLGAQDQDQHAYVIELARQDLVEVDRSIAHWNYAGLYTIPGGISTATPTHAPHTTAIPPVPVPALHPFLHPLLSTIATTGSRPARLAHPPIGWAGPARRAPPPPAIPLPFPSGAGWIAGTHPLPMWASPAAPAAPAAPPAD